MTMERISGVHIRRAGPADFEVVQDLMCKLYIIDNPIGDTNAEWPRLEDGREHIWERLGGVGACFLGLTVLGEPVGYATVDGISEGSAMVGRRAVLENVFVEEAWRGQGVGTRLCRKAEQWAWRQGADHMIVTAYAQNIRAQNLYRRLGFEAYLQTDRKQRPPEGGA